MVAVQVHQSRRPGELATGRAVADADYDYLRLARLPAAIDDHARIDVVDLFAGCGGLTLGAIEGARREGLNAQLALAVDSDAAPLRVLEDSLGVSDDAVSVSDLEELLRGRRSAWGRDFGLRAASGNLLLLAGPPCQGHSALNNRTRHMDTRNGLYMAVAAAAEVLEPTAVVIENVRGISADRLGTMDQCADKLAALGYHVDWKRLDLHELGVPQRRVRHVLVATSGRPFEWQLDQAPDRDLRWAIGDLVSLQGSAGVFDRPSDRSPENQRRIDWLFEHDELNLPNPLRPRCHHDEHSYVSMYGRLTWDQPAQTITSGFGSMGQGRYVHPQERRTLTPHEAARLQFLPDFMRFESVRYRGALATMIGNAAPPKLAMAMTQALLRQGLL